MSDSVIQRLSALSTERLRRGDGASLADLAEVETRNGVRLPDDLRETLEFSNGLGIHSDGTQMFLYNAHDLAWTSSEPHFKEGLPGMLILGTDGEGSVYYADLFDRNGRGAHAVYLVRMSDLDLPSSIFVGANFGDAVRTVLDNTDLYARSELRESQEPDSR